MVCNSTWLVWYVTVHGFYGILQYMAHMGRTEYGLHGIQQYMVLHDNEQRRLFIIKASCILRFGS